MRIHLLSLIIASSLTLSTCGSNTSRTPTDLQGATGTSGQTLASSSELSMALVASNLNETASSVSSGDLTIDTTGLRLADPGISVTRSCTANTTAKTATVTINYSGEAKASFGKITIDQTASGSETRLWSNIISNAAIACTQSGKRAQILWSSAASVNGLNLVDTVARSNTRVTTFTAGKRTLSDAAAGTRTITWATPTGATDGTSATKTAVVDVTHTQNLTRVDGTTFDISAEHATLTNAPMIITRTSNASGITLTYLITSGTMSITKLGSFYVTNAFSNVLFDLSSTDPCTPTSGTITTNIYNSSSDTKALKTYTINFASSGATVASNTTATTNLDTNINHSCDLVAVKL